MKDLPLLVFFDTGSHSATPYREVLRGIRSAAVKASVRIQTVSEKELNTCSLRNTAPSAIIASDSITFVRQVIHFLRSEGRTCVLAGLDGEQFGADISCATPSRRAETQQMIRYLHASGCEKLALVGFGVHSINDNFRYHAAMNAASSLHLDLQEKDVWFWEDDAEASLLSFIQKAASYQAAICPNDNIAIQLIHQGRLHGIRVPDDLWVCSFGNKIISRYHSPSVTTMTMDMAAVGEQSFYAWQFLSRQPAGSSTSVHLLVPGSLLIRESTAGVQLQSRSDPPPALITNDPFYSDPFVQPLAALENCLSACDDLDLRILALLMEEKSYEAIVEILYISQNALKYRLGKIYASVNTAGKKDFIRFVRQQLNSPNPFRDHLISVP